MIISPEPLLLHITRHYPGYTWETTSPNYLMYTNTIVLQKYFLKQPNGIVFKCFPNSILLLHNRSRNAGTILHYTSFEILLVLRNNVKGFFSPHNNMLLFLKHKRYHHFINSIGNVIFFFIFKNI